MLDSKEIAKGRVDATLPVRFSTEETLDTSEGTSTSVTLKYDVPLKFTGKIDTVVVDYKSLADIKPVSTGGYDND
jgi:hypothetical protein